MSETPQVGSTAPDFELRDQHGQQVRLSSFRGERAVVLMFYPYAFSNVCTGELCRLHDSLSVFDDAGVKLLAVSVDSKYTLVILAAKRAREINSYYTQLGAGRGEVGQR